MQIGLDSFVENTPFAPQGRMLAPAQRVANLLDEIVLAEQVGLDSYGIGEHHREDYLASTPAVLLAAAAARTARIRLSSAVTVLSSADPVRTFQDFATLDLISNGRAEIIVGRGSFVESYPLFGLDLKDYDDLFREKLDLLLKLREQTEVHWSGKHRSALSGQGVYPRPVQKPLPVWLGVGGTPNSFARAGSLGLPLAVAIIGGEPHRFRPLVDLYRESARRAGHDPSKLRIAVHTQGFVADTTEEAAETHWPAYYTTFSRIGRERGWGPVTRAQYDATRRPTGALVVGNPEDVARKILHVHEALGGIDRFEVQLTAGSIAHDRVLHAIRLMGEQVRPAVLQALPAEAQV